MRIISQWNHNTCFTFLLKMFLGFVYTFFFFSWIIAKRYRYNGKQNKTNQHPKKKDSFAPLQCCVAKEDARQNQGSWLWNKICNKRSKFGVLQKLQTGFAIQDLISLGNGRKKIILSRSWCFTFPLYWYLLAIFNLQKGINKT